MRSPLAALLAGGLVLVVAACAAATGAGVPEPEAGEKNSHVLLAATADGAIVADFGAMVLAGVDRSGRKVWEDKSAMERGAEVTCAAKCPDPVFAIADGVAIEQDAQGNWLRLNGSDVRVPLPAPDVVWSETADRTEAVAFSPRAQGSVLRLRKESSGWRVVDDKASAGDAFGACVAGGNVLLTGSEPVLLNGNHRVPVHTDMAGAGECVLGASGGLVLKRFASAQGKHKTSVRGVDLTGTQLWSRDLPCDADVSAHPSGRTFALVCNGKLELVDHSGRTGRTRDGVLSARYTAAGELVQLVTGDRVDWSAP